jgi:hypothetical protein
MLARLHILIRSVYDVLAVALKKIAYIIVVIVRPSNQDYNSMSLRVLIPVSFEFLYRKSESRPGRPWKIGVHYV